ncbi:hypothetical protein QYE76_011345 [Lolium multiflorum]|uniref:Retrotransposon gag domain-containing protein n=1 Tax=Lolium multiflorum TaxID=4521 RepID=A0AAD8TYZ0_LOLMU|nr:hypothetical protein QYE76_011345 [Lolium multiflorum]
MLATAKKFANTAMAMLEERQEAEEVMESFLKREREAEDSLQKAKKLQEQWESMMGDAHKEADRIRREAIVPRKINFATPTDQLPLTTPKDNMKKAAELLAMKDEGIDINHLRTLVASAVKQQSKAELRAGWNPTRNSVCPPRRRTPPEGNIVMMNRAPDLRSAEEGPENIQIRSWCPRKHLQRTQRRERVRCTLAGTSTGTRHLRPGSRVHLRHLAVVVQSETPDPMGLVESISATTRHLRGIGTRSARRNFVGAGTKNASLSPAEAGTREATAIMGKVATEAGVSSRKGAGNLKAEAKGPTGPLADLPSQWRRWRRRPEIPLPFTIPSQWPARCPGTERPDTWIDDYFNAVLFAGGNQKIACRMLQLYLIGPARTWLSDLEENSIFCWFDLKIAFEKHFRGTYKRPATTSDLQACIQKKGETSQNFLTRWLATRNECDNVDNRTAMHAFIGGLQRGGLLRHKLTYLINQNNLTLDDMITIASNHTAADDDAGGELAATALSPHQQKKNRDNGGSSNNNKRKNPSDEQKSSGSDMVAMTFQRGGYKRARKHRPRGKGGKGKNKEKDEDSSEVMDEDDASPDIKEASAANKSNPFVKKSAGATSSGRKNPCTFDRADHPTIIPKECYALVVSPRIDGYDFSKCLMDGRANLNILYLETLERMNLTKEQLKHNTTKIHGVVPGKKANSLGSIKLPVAFGDVNNFREEMITFEVVPFKSSYHVIFSRPTYHKFHARACYIYNKLKIPGPNGMITVSGDYKKARDYKEGEVAFAESIIYGDELQGYRAAVDPSEMESTKKQISEQKASFKAAIDTKKVDLKKGDSSKQVSVGADLDPK